MWSETDLSLFCYCVEHFMNNDVSLLLSLRCDLHVLRKYIPDLYTCLNIYNILTGQDSDIVDWALSVTDELQSQKECTCNRGQCFCCIYILGFETQGE